MKKSPNVPSTIYGKLKKPNKLTPYYSRAEIDYQGALTGRKLELLWVDDLVDAFFLHIQGSGIVSLPNGKQIQINFNGKNGHPYHSIGRYMIRKGYLKKGEASMQSIKKYLREHPERQQQILSRNPSYIFFRAVKEGPLGALEVPLTPYRSIATDLKYFPPGSLAIIKVPKPIFDINNEIVDWKSSYHLVLNQDTGSAIKGPYRVDLFTGFGEKSELVAGQMTTHGELYLLAPKKKDGELL